MQEKGFIKESSILLMLISSLVIVIVLAQGVLGFISQGPIYYSQHSFPTYSWLGLQNILTIFTIILMLISTLGFIIGTVFYLLSNLRQSIIYNQNEINPIKKGEFICTSCGTSTIGSRECCPSCSVEIHEHEQNIKMESINDEIHSQEEPVKIPVVIVEKWISDDTTITHKETEGIIGTIVSEQQTNEAGQGLDETRDMHDLVERIYQNPINKSKKKTAKNKNKNI